MRKSFKLIVYICLSAIGSLLLALILSPLRSSFGEYSKGVKEKVVTSVGFDFEGTNNVVGTNNVGTDDSSTIALNNAPGKKRNTANSLGATQNNGMSGISYSLLQYAEKSQPVGDINTREGSGVYASNSSFSSSSNTPASLGFNNNTTNNGNSNARLIGFNTLTTDLTSANSSTRQGATYNPGAGGPPPDDASGEVPLAPPGGSLPISDGTSLLLVMAMIFGGWKSLKGLNRIKGSRV